MPESVKESMEETSKTAVSVAQILAYVESRFEQAELSFGHGMGCAVDEAAHLIAHVIADAPTLTEEMLKEIILPERLEQLTVLVETRINSRRPAAYLTGEAWFGGVKFKIDERVIIPRSPIAELLVDGFAPWIDPSAIGSVLDLCAGSGCIAMVSALRFESATVDAAELSADALALAAENCQRLGLEQRVTLIESDLYNALGGKQYDLIISNPPYVPVRRELPAEYGHEPALALFAGEDGLDLAWPILAGAIDHLNPGGWLVLEVGEAMDALMRQVPQLPAMWMEFEGGAEGVMLISRAELLSCESRLRELSESLNNSAG